MWIAVHFYHEKKTNYLLSKLVNPLLHLINEQKLSEQFFFINYYDEIGTHIRLRLKVPEGSNQQLLISIIEEETERFIKIDAALRSYRFMDYDPEVDRYGGAKAIEIAEDHFQDSSKTVLEFTTRSTEWSYEKSLTNALAMQVAFLHAISFSYEQIEELSSHMINHWISSATNYHKSIIPNEEDDNVVIKNIESAFVSSFSKQKEVITEICASLWDSLNSREFEDDAIRQWYGGVEETHSTLSELQKKGGIFLTEEWGGGEDYSELSVIYESYMHMTNNRNGISNMDEAFLGYILTEVLTELQKRGLIRTSVVH